MSQKAPGLAERYQPAVAWKCEEWSPRVKGEEQDRSRESADAEVEHVFVSPTY